MVNIVVKLPTELDTNAKVYANADVYSDYDALAS